MRNRLGFSLHHGKKNAVDFVITYGGIQVARQQLKILKFFIFLCKLFLRSFGSIVVNSFKDFDFAACIA